MFKRFYRKFVAWTIDTYVGYFTMLVFFFALILTPTLLISVPIYKYTFVGMVVTSAWLALDYDADRFI